VTWLMLQSSQHAPLAITPFWPPNNFTHTLPAATCSYPVSHKLFSYFTNTVLSLFTWRTSILECSRTSHLWLSVSFGVMRTWILLLVFSLLSLILCIWAV
jgi:hypothetical protein